MGLPPADLPENAGGTRRRPRGSKGAGTRSSGRERSSRYLLQPRSLSPRLPRPSRPPGAPPPPSRLTRPWPGPSAAPTHPEPRASENPLQAGAGRTYHMQLHLGTSTSGGVSAHSSSYSRSMRNPPLRGPKGGAEERAGGETEAKTPPSSACENPGRQSRQCCKGVCLWSRWSPVTAAESCRGCSCHAVRGPARGLLRSGVSWSGCLLNP